MYLLTRIEKHYIKNLHRDPCHKCFIIIYSDVMTVHFSVQISYIAKLISRGTPAIFTHQSLFQGAKCINQAYVKTVLTPLSMQVSLCIKIHGQ